MHRWTIVGAAALTAGAIAAAGAGAQDDTMRLGTSVDAKTTTLAFDGQIDTVLTHGGRGGFGHAGFRGAGVGFYRGGFGGGYRGGFAVGYRVGYGYGGGYGYRGGYGYGGYGYGVGYGGWYGGYGYWGRPWYPSLYVTVGSPYYYTPPAAYYAPGYSYYPINLPTTVASAPALPYQLPLQGAPNQLLPAPTPVPGIPGQPGFNGNFKYDGGPANPVPLPGDGQAPVFQPAPKVLPQDGKYVSLPSQSTTTTTTNRSGFAFPAYGDAPQPTTFASDRAPVIITGSAKR